MVSDIKPLSVEVVHRIAAGEVIDSLAAAVRELIDNAIDAGASRIAIAIWPEDWRVRIADNGSGMGLADLQRAATPHTTSKIHTCEDLSRITSLGFRGEALHSLTQLATLEIYSRPATAEAGWHAIYGPRGEVVQMETTAIAPGTIVEVQDLFQNWPERRQALPHPTQQLRAIQTAIHQSALCHPTLAWQVQQRDRPWFRISPSQSAQAILPQLLSTVRPGDLQSLSMAIPLGDRLPSQNLEIEPDHLEVVAGLPDRCHRHRPDWVQVAVNGRCVKVGGEETTIDPLVQSILSAFRQTLPRHRHPICFVHLRLAPEHIDWHRHPAKADIYLHRLPFWQEQITQAIHQALQLQDSGVPGPLSTTGLWPSQRLQQLLKVSEAQGVYQFGSAPSLPDQDLTTLVNPGSSLDSLRAVAQIHQTYILAEHPAGLWLVEQHIAHERVLYEQLCQQWQLVELNPPIILNHLTPPQVEQLQQLEITVDPFGPDLWAIRLAPALLINREDCSEALTELSQTPNLQAALVATACRSAIRNGTGLNLEQMQTLLDQWQRTRHPRTCPHGRPIYLALEESHLARYFRRHWVIGKSHGI